MNVEQLEQLKQEFQNERREQITRAKEFQKETLERRKAMQMKAQLEAAKEEKRIKEALAERRAQHIEATMRFQKGMKHFKYNKEKISIEEVLKKINQRSRKNSIDDKVIIYNSELASFLNSSSRSQLRRSSSFDSLNMNNTNEMNKKLNSTDSFRNKHKTQQVEYKSSGNLNGSQIKSKQEVINENQKAIQEINREAFKEFQMKILNGNHALNTNSSFRPLQSQTQQIHYQQVKPHTIQQQQQQQQQQLMHQQHNSDFDVLNSNLANNLKQKAMNFKSNNESDLVHSTKSSNYNTKNSNYNLVSEEEDCDDKDSMDTDSLLNEGIDLTEKITTKTTANKIDGEDDEVDEYNEKVLAKTHYYTDPFAYLSNMTFPLNDRLNSTFDMKKLNLNSTPSSPVTRETSKNKTVKSILKRSTSYDNNLNIMNKNSTKDLNIDTRRDKIKDSLELTNARINRTDSISSDQMNKKTVRFAAVNSNQPSTTQSQKQLNFEIAPIVMNNHQQQQQQQQTQLTSESVKNVANEKNQKMQTEPQLEPSSNETSLRSRISSTDSIRRPIIKSRNTSQLQQKQPANKKSETSTHQAEEILNNTNNTSNNPIDSNRSNMNSNRENTKPPIHPNTTATTINQLLFAGGQNGSYLMLNQRRKELVQKKTNEQGLNSPKTIVMNSPSSTCSNATINTNRITETPLNMAYNNNSFNNNSNSGFRIPFSQQILPISSPSLTSNKPPVTNQPVRNQSENDIQQAKTSTPTNEIMINRKLNTDQFNFTRIPLSPKSNLTRNMNMQQTATEHLIQKRPFSAIISTSNINNYLTKPPLPSAAHTQLLVNPLTNEHQAYQDQTQTPSIANNKPNVKYGYMNNQQYFQNTTGGAIYSGPRVLSADSISNTKYTNPLVQLEIKYPLYSNFQTQTQYINISKPMRVPTQQNQQANNSQEVGESLRAFLKAEEMSTKGCTESQIINTVQDMNKRVPLRTNPINLSLEEENVKNSIMRLNERLKMFSNPNGATGTNSNNLNNLMRVNEYENMNKYRSTKPISSAALKIQR